MKNTCIHGLHVFLVCSNAGVRLTPTQVMDRLWQQHGLDLQMTPYGCTATSRCASPARFSVSIIMMICYLALPCLQPPLCTHTLTHSHTLTHTHTCSDMGIIEVVGRAQTVAKIQRASGGSLSGTYQGLACSGQGCFHITFFIDIRCHYTHLPTPCYCVHPQHSKKNPFMIGFALSTLPMYTTCPLF